MVRVYKFEGDRVVRLQDEDGKLVKIQEGAFILLNTKYTDVPVDFGVIEVGDELTLYGLGACDALDVDFYAYVVLINKLTDPPPPSKDQCEDGYKPQLLEMQYTGEDCAASKQQPGFGKDRLRRRSPL